MLEYYPMNDKLKLGYVIAAIFFGIFFFGLLNPVFTVGSGERAIIFNRFYGLKKTTYGEGLHIKVPFVEETIYYDIRKQPYDVEATSAASKDLQDIKVDLRFLYRPSVDKLAAIHRDLGPNYPKKVFPSITREVTKAVIATKTAEEVITQREDVSRRIRDAITERASTYNIEIEDVAISDIKFSTTFSEAIEQKQVARQQEEASRLKANANRILTESLRNSPELIELKKIEAQQKIAETLSTSSNVVYIPNDMVLMMQPIGSKSSSARTTNSSSRFSKK